MGLELVELVLRVEEAFGIEITDDEAVAAETVGQLHQCILSKLEQRQSRRCPSSEVFYGIRRALVSLFSMNRRAVSPDTTLNSLFPLPERQDKWSRFCSSSQFPVPRLRPPRWVRDGLIFTGILLGAGLVVTWSARFPGLGSGLLIAGICGFVPLLCVARRLAVCFPPGWTDLRDLTWWSLAASQRRTPEPSHQWNSSDVWETYRALVADQLDIDKEAVVPDASWVRVSE